MSSNDILEHLNLKEFESKWEHKLKHKDGGISGTLILSDKVSVEVEGIKLNWKEDLYTINLENISSSLKHQDTKKEEYTKSQHYNALYDSAGVSGLSKIKSPTFIHEIEEKLKTRKYLTVAPDTNVLSKQFLSRYLLKILERNGKKERKINWIQIIIPSCILWELENNVNRALYTAKGSKGQAYLGLQEIKNLKNKYPTFIVEDKPEILLTTPSREVKNIRYDHLICRQLKDFMKYIERFENVYFLTMDKALSSIAKIMDIKTVYIPHPEKEKVMNSISYSILQEGWTYTPLTQFLWCLVHTFTEVIIELKDNNKKIKIIADYPNKFPEEWLDGKILVEEI